MPGEGEAGLPGAGIHLRCPDLFVTIKGVSDLCVQSDGGRHVPADTEADLVFPDDFRIGRLHVLGEGGAHGYGGTADHQ